MKSYLVKIVKKTCKKLKKILSLKEKTLFLWFLLRLVYLFCLLFFGNVIISSLTTSIYNINDLSSSLDNLKVGDNINYEINGYSDCKIISIDKEME